jgi:tRNA1(Val) A37 N6-methylase TrmN6
LSNIQSFGKQGFDLEQLNDAFSRSQIRSKIWLVSELAKINSDWKDVVVFAGWFGQLSLIFRQQLSYQSMRVVELDAAACRASDYVFNLANLTEHKIKAINADINLLALHKNGYEWQVKNFKDNSEYNEKFLPDLIINTSAEHMTEEWFHQLRFKQLSSDPIVAIQSNNLFDIPEHINCVHSVDHMKKKFPMREVLFAGELQLKGYKRVMLIGRP